MALIAISANLRLSESSFTQILHGRVTGVRYGSSGARLTIAPCVDRNRDSNSELREITPP